MQHMHLDEDYSNIPLARLEGFYDTLIDRQFWFETNAQKIHLASPTRYRIIYDIYFHPTILSCLSILDDTIPFRKIELIKLLQTFVALVKMTYGDREDLLVGLPPLNPTPPRANRPRVRLPIGIPPPPLRFTHSQLNHDTHTNYRQHTNSNPITHTHKTNQITHL